MSGAPPPKGWTIAVSGKQLERIVQGLEELVAQLRDIIKEDKETYGEQG